MDRLRAFMRRFIDDESSGVSPTVILIGAVVAIGVALFFLLTGGDWFTGASLDEPVNPL